MLAGELKRVADQALLGVQIGSALNGRKSTVLVWVDTAFNGGLVQPRHEIQRLGLKGIWNWQYDMAFPRFHFRL